MQCQLKLKQNGGTLQDADGANGSGTFAPITGTVPLIDSVTDQKSYGNVSFHSGGITIKGSRIEFQGGTTIELGTELEVINQ